MAGSAGRPWAMLARAAGAGQAASSVEEDPVTLAKGAVPLLTEVSPEPGSSRPRRVAIAALDQSEEAVQVDVDEEPVLCKGVGHLRVLSILVTCPKSVIFIDGYR